VVVTLIRSRWARVRKSAASPRVLAVTLRRPLLEQVPGVIQRRDLGQVDAGIASVPPRPSVGGTMPPTGAKMIAESSGSGAGS
jgi:hypothetical protein